MPEVIALPIVDGSEGYLEWMERELSEIRPAEIRVELQDPAGFVLASSGPEPGLGRRAPGCGNDGTFRVCGAKAGLFTVVASVDRLPDRAAHHRLLLALLVVAGIAGVLVSLVSRHIARRASGPGGEAR